MLHRAWEEYLSASLQALDDWRSSKISASYAFDLFRFSVSEFWISAILLCNCAMVLFASSMLLSDCDVTAFSLSSCAFDSWTFNLSQSSLSWKHWIPHYVNKFLLHVLTLTITSMWHAWIRGWPNLKGTDFQALYLSIVRVWIVDAANCWHRMFSVSSFVRHNLYR